MLDLALGSQVCLDNVWDCALQELDIIFNTNYTELIGQPKFGSEFMQFLHNLQTTPREIEDYVNMIIKQCYYVTQLHHEVTIGIEYDAANYDRIIYVRITLSDNEKELSVDYDLSNLMYTSVK